jgi:hypothetical protein
LSVELIRRPAGQIIALASISLGLFLLIVSVAEFPSHRRLLLELTLISPLFLYAAESLRKLVR